MALWTRVQCDYFDGHKICPAFFRTQLSWRPAMREAKQYGWTRTKRFGIRCKMHPDIESVKYSWQKEEE